MKKTVLLISLLLSMFSIYSKDRVSFWMHPQRDQLEKDDSYLYSVGLSIHPDSHILMTLDEEMKKYGEAKFRINGVEYYYADFNYVLKDLYMGRDRKESYIWVKAGEKIFVELLEGFPQALSFSILVPEVINAVTISPELVMGEKTQGSYVVEWSVIDCDQYTYMLGHPGGGDGTSIQSNSLDISSPTEWIEVEINSQNILEIEDEVMKFSASVSGPIPQVISNFSWDDPSIWGDEPIIMYEDIPQSDSPTFVGSGFSPEGPLIMTEGAPSGYTTITP